MKAPVRVSLAVCLAALAAGPAAATHGGIHPTFRKEAVYFHCAGPTKVSNVNNAAADNAPAPWDTNPPAQSVTEGAGCGAIDLGVVRDTGYVDAFFKGTFTGNIRDITVSLHHLLLGRARQAPGYTVKVQWLEIDGVPLIENLPIPVTPVLSSTGASELVEFSITDIGSATEIKDADGNVIDVKTTGLATEDGDGTTVHEVMLMIDTDPNETNSIWVWDTTEVPSGIVFNPDTLASARLKAGGS
jgi:hypothetical protein